MPMVRPWISTLLRGEWTVSTRVASLVVKFCADVRLVSDRVSPSPKRTLNVFLNKDEYRIFTFVALNWRGFFSS